MKLSLKVVALIWIFAITCQAVAGEWTANHFIYKPSLGARGATEKNNYDTGQDRIDSRLGKEIWVGDPLYGDTLQESLSVIGSQKVILRLAAGTYNIASNLTIPANITLNPERGAILSIATSVTLTINGPLKAGLYQIFNCIGTGKVVFGPGAVKSKYCEWWAQNNTPGTTDMTTALQAALNSGSGELMLLDTTYLFSNLTYGEHTHIKGQGASTILKMAGTGIGIGRVPPLSGSITDVSFRNFTINLNNTGNCGLMLEGTWYGVADHVNAINIPSGTFTYDDGGGSAVYPCCGIMIKGKSAGSPAAGAYYNLINQCSVYGVNSSHYADAGIVATSTDGISRANSNRLIQNITRYCNKGIYLKGNDNYLLGNDTSCSEVGVWDDGIGNRQEKVYSEICTIVPVLFGEDSAGDVVASIASLTVPAQPNQTGLFFITGRAGTFQSGSVSGLTFTPGESLSNGSGWTGTLVKLISFNSDTEEALLVCGINGTLSAGDTITGGTSGATAVYRTGGAGMAVAADFGTSNNLNSIKTENNWGWPNWNLGHLANLWGLSFYPKSWVSGHSYIAYPQTSSSLYLYWATNNAADVITNRFHLNSHVDVATLTLDACNLDIGANRIYSNQQNISSSAGTLNLSSVVAKQYYCILTESITNITFPPTPPSGKAASFRLVLRQAATGGPYTVTIGSGNGKFAGGSFTMTTNPNKTDVLTFAYNYQLGFWYEVSRSQNM
jgi:hypothetical protein